MALSLPTHKALPSTFATLSSETMFGMPRALRVNRIIDSDINLLELVSDASEARLVLRRLNAERASEGWFPVELSKSSPDVSSRAS